jgi:hypothetical protein
VGEDRQDATGPPPTERVSVPQAADHLGTTVDALRKRVQRGTIPHERDRDGRVWILLDTGRPRQDTDQDTGRPQSEPDALISEMRGRIEDLREQLEAERQAHAEARRIIAGLVERIPPAIEAPASPEAREAPETVEESDRAEPRSATAEAQDELGAERARREMAETTMHEGMAEERRRREAAERERDELRRQLFARREPQGSPQTVEEAPDRDGPGAHFATGGAQEGARRPWWRRIVGR